MKTVQNISVMKKEGRRPKSGPKDQFAKTAGIPYFLSSVFK